MSSLRIAVLVFVIGASFANYFFTKEQHDQISPSVATPAPQGLEDRYGPTPPAPDPGELRRVYAEVNDKGWMREAIIVTIAGVAWFVLAPKQRERP